MILALIERQPLNQRRRTGEYNGTPVGPSQAGRPLSAGAHGTEPVGGRPAAWLPDVACCYVYLSVKPTDFVSSDGADQILGALALWLPLPTLYPISFIVVERCSPAKLRRSPS